MPARITACYPDKPARESVLFEDSHYQVGRDLDCEVRLNHPSVSRKHAFVTAKDEQWFLKDSLSANGVKVNGQKVDDQQLSSNDIISLGNIDYDYRDAKEIETEFEFSFSQLIAKLL